METRLKGEKRGTNQKANKESNQPDHSIKNCCRLITHHLDRLIFFIVVSKFKVSIYKYSILLKESILLILVVLHVEGLSLGAEITTAQGGLRIGLGPRQKCVLPGLPIFLLSTPCLEGRGLQSTAKGE